MTFASGSRTGVADPAADLYTLIEAELTTHANWTFVEQWDVSSTRWQVWQCGTANAAGVAYHVFFGYSTVAGSTTLVVGVAENYRTSDHSFNHPAPNPPSSTSTPAADSSWGGGTYYALDGTVGNTTNMHRVTLGTSGSAFDYWIAVNNNGLMLVTQVGSTPYQVVVQMYESLVRDSAMNDPVPLLISQVNNGSTVSSMYASSTRHPMVTTAIAKLFGIYNLGQNVVFNMMWTPPAQAGQAGLATGDLFQNKEPGASRVAVLTWATPASTAGKLRGLYRDIVVLAPASGVATGDTVTIDGDTYVYLGFSSGDNSPWYNTSAV